MTLASKQKLLRRDARQVVWHPSLATDASHHFTHQVRSAG